VAPPAQPAPNLSGEGSAPEPAASSANGVPTIRLGGVKPGQLDAEPITQRELEVLALVAEGYSNKLISAELSISERTVKNRLIATMGKLRASDRTRAVVTTTRLGWLEL